MKQSTGTPSSAAISPEPIHYLPTLSNLRREKYAAVVSYLHTLDNETLSRMEPGRYQHAAIAFHVKAASHQEAIIHADLTAIALREDFGGIILHFWHCPGQEDTYDGVAVPPYALFHEVVDGEVDTTAAEALSENVKTRALHPLLWLHAHDYVHGDMADDRNLFAIKEINEKIRNTFTFVIVIGGFALCRQTTSFLDMRAELLSLYPTGKEPYAFSLTPGGPVKENSDLFGDRVINVLRQAIRVTVASIKTAPDDKTRERLQKTQEHLMRLGRERDEYESTPAIQAAVYKELASTCYIAGGRSLLSNFSATSIPRKPAESDNEPEDAAVSPGRAILPYLPTLSASRLEKYHAVTEYLGTLSKRALSSMEPGLNRISAEVAFYVKPVQKHECIMHEFLTARALQDNFGGIILSYRCSVGRQGIKNLEGQPLLYFLFLEPVEGEVTGRSEKIVEAFHPLLWLHAHHVLHEDLHGVGHNVFQLKEDNKRLTTVLGDFGESKRSKSFLKKRRELLVLYETSKPGGVVMEKDLYSETTEDMLKKELKHASAGATPEAQARAKHVADLLKKIAAYEADPVAQAALYEELASQLYLLGR